MISLQSALAYTSWADEKLFTFLMTLPDDAWRARATDEEWHIAALTFHLVASADWYRYQLGGPLTFTAEPQSIAEVRSLGETWREINNFLLLEAGKEDELITYTEDGRTFSERRSTVLLQAVTHSVEHRVHIATTLKASGFASLELEDYAVWAFESETAHK